MPQSGDGSRELGRKTGLSREAFESWISNQNQSWKFSESTLEALRSVEFPEMCKGNAEDENGEDSDG